ncbi:S1-like domain-containing RNA-binding protein [uncultured Peptoniphilus sp.]|uniref:CvfB family protein n=1 Tax=uncultured Peptoniphilus sp. TaxID=254354 RepID=UPI0028055DFE|nr:S1-like domain-containing RNA-binding protein [uncultured Peptoniphilus sp.]
MDLGKIQNLRLKKIENSRGILVDDEGNEALIDKEEIKDVKISEEVRTFIYNGHKGEIWATRKKPYIELGQLKKLKLSEKSKFGYFVDIGLDKDILLPFAESYGRLNLGKEYLLYLYHDRSDRLALTMNIKDKLKINDKFKVNDMVRGIIYSIGKPGYFVAVDNTYDAMIPKEEVKGLYVVGDEVEARVARILKNGFITLTLREKAYKQIDADADEILDLLRDNSGIIYLGDKSRPEEIKEITGLSKSAFKRALGKLYKKRLVELYDRKTVLNNGK